MPSCNASIRVKVRTEIISLGRAATCYLLGWLLWTAVVFAHPPGGNAPLAIPIAPSSLSLRISSHSQIDLAWIDNSNNEEGFEIERRPASAAAFTRIVTLGPNFEVFADSGLAGNTKYFYRVRAYNNAGSSVYSNIVSGTTLPTPPATPGNLTAKAVSTNRIDLTWTDNSANEEGLQLERRLGTAAAFARIATLGPNANFFADTNLVNNTKYFYRLHAFNAGGASDYSAVVSETTLPMPPAAPGKLTATTAGGTQIKLVWQDKSDNESGFKIERKILEGGAYIQVALAGANVTSFSSAALSPNTKYYFRVRAYNRGGDSDYTNEASATTLPKTPEVPSLLSAVTVSNVRIDLAWQDNAANEDSFKIERRQGAAGAFAQIARAGANVKKFVDSSLAANTTYFYRVRASNRGGHSAYSNAASATTLPDRPAAPGNLTATTRSNTQIILAWQDNAANEDSFKIERGAPGKFTTVATLPANAKSFSDKGLAANATYFYRLRAVNRGGDSDYSNEASAVTFPNPPSAPGRVTATTVSYNRIHLAWTDSSNNETGFRIERKPGATGTYAEVAKVDANITRYFDSNLAGNTIYFYRLRAFNAGGHSGYSDETSATTLPNPPSAPSRLAASLALHNRIDLVWQDNGSNETGFRIERASAGSPDADGKYEEIIALGPNATTYSNTGLAERTRYFYRIRAYNAGGFSAYSNVLEIVTPPISPNAPGNLAATPVSNTQIRLAWLDKSATEDNFEIERKLGAAGTYAGIAKAGANATGYVDKNLAANTTYFYRVRAFNGGGHSDYSNTASTATLPNAPAAPGNLSAAVVSSNQINLAWQDKASNEDSFKLERKPGEAGQFAVVATLGANANKFSDNALSPNTRYFYRLRASNRGGFSDYSNETSAATLPLAPATPGKLFATTVSTTRLDLAWIDSAANEVGFEIERRSSTGVFQKIATIEANSVGYADKNLEVNTKYFYRVRAFNAGGFSSYSNETSAVTLPIPPLAPSRLVASTVSNKQINLAWQDNAANEDSFKIERKLGEAGKFAVVATLGANANKFSDAVLAANTRYFYRVRALNRGGQSEYSNEAGAATLPNRPEAPANLIATTMSNSRINLAWQDKASNEDSFKIERGSASPTIYKEIAKVGANVTSYSDLNLAANTAFFYRVRAANAGGHSEYSNEANATTLPNPPLAPSQLTASTVSNKQINLAWQDNAANEDSFKVERGSPGAYQQIARLGANATNFSDAELAPNTEYFYRVRASNRGGHSGYSNETRAATLPNAPRAPGQLQAATISASRIKLTWADSADNEAGFRIERKTIVGSYAEVAVINANTTSHEDAGLENDTRYFYRIRAHNPGGQSGYSNEANAATLPVPPAAPGNLKATTKGSSQIELAWADSSNNEDGFKIERKIGPAGKFREIAATAANVTVYSSRDLAASTPYFYRVRAFNRATNSAYSNTAEAVTLPKPPAAPGDLVATVRPNLQIDLIWADKSSNADSFKIERRLTGSPYALIATVGKETTSYSDIGLQPVTQYFYRVRAANSGGASAYSNEAKATTLIRPPATPKNLTAATVSNSQIRLAWADSSNDENGFKIERGSTGSPQSSTGSPQAPGSTGSPYVEIAALGPNVKSLIDSSLSGNTEYFYRVRAYNAGGHSAYSNEAGAQTLPNPPAKPSELIAVAVSDTKINLAWADNSDNEAGFKIERGSTGSPQGSTSSPQAAGSPYAQIATVGVNVKSFADSSLAANTDYVYRIRAFNAGGHSSYSNEANMRTLPNTPIAPNNLTAAVVSVRQINLAWADNAHNEFGFKIERKNPPSGGAYAEIARVGANVKRFADSSLAGKTTYFYRVRAFNAGGSSAYTNEASATTLPYPPAAPSNLAIAAVSSRQVKLTWADNSNNESNFRIERRVTAAGTYAVIAAVSANVNSFADTGLAALTPYFYRVYAFNAGGHSGYSNEASATTLPNPPAAPDSLTATAVSHLRINLQWKDLSDNESGFQIERRIGAGGGFVQIASVGLGVTNFFDTNLTGNKEYYYRVRAFNAGGYSNYSNDVKSVTLPITPGSLSGTSLSNRRLTITWTDSSNNESGFRIERRLFETEFAEITFVGTNVHAYVDSNLTPNTVYYYRVRAFNFGGLSAYSNEAPVATLPNPPARPRALNVMRLPNLSLGLAWTDSSDTEIGFAIERKLAVDSAFAEAGIVDANVTAYLDTGLVAETRYFYRVRAFNTGGYSLYSNEDNNVTLEAPPAAPSELLATIGGSTRINLSWTEISDNESGFKIERKLASDSAYAEIAAVGANVRSYSDQEVTPGAAYLYRVRAFNAGGTSNYSNAVNATPTDDANLAVGRPALASSADLVGPANRAVDGNLTTFWRSDTITAPAPYTWLRVELHPSSEIIIDHVVIRWQQTFFAREFEIQTSGNGTGWTTVYTTNAGKIGVQEVTFTSTSARFVRLYMKRNNKANYRVTELEVYNGFAKTAGHAASNDAFIPATVTLRPNYPNPFSANGTSGNPATTISYALPEDMPVTLKVLNVAGQVVATLIEGYQERGIYHVDFNARKLPSGVYFAVLQAGKVRRVQRMVLAK